MREYPYNALASHVIGHIGEISEEELEEHEERQAEAEDARYVASRVPSGRSRRQGRHREGVRGLAQRKARRAPDRRRRPRRSRRGDAAATRRSAAGTRSSRSTPPSRTRPRTHSSSGIELARELEGPRSGKKFKAPAGAVVALDPRSGEVLALASNPDFDPNLFVGSAPTRTSWPQLNAPDAQHAVPQPRDRGSRAAGLDVQADHGHGRRRGTMQTVSETARSVVPGSSRSGTAVFRDWKPDGHGKRRACPARSPSRATSSTTRSASRLDARQEDDKLGEHLQEVAQRVRLRTQDRHRPLGRAQGPRRRRRVEVATVLVRPDLRPPVVHRVTP